MTARSRSNGHPIEFNGEDWVWSDTKEKIEPNTKVRLEINGHKCRNCGKPPVKLTVFIAEDLSHTGKSRWDQKPIDACIAPLIKELNKCGCLTRFSCCGHGMGNGEIQFHDGTKINIPTRQKRNNI